MPYEEEEASKIRHGWAAAAMESFASECETLSMPADEQIRSAQALMSDCSHPDKPLRAQAVAIDGSCGEVSVSSGIPGSSVMTISLGGLSFSRGDLLSAAPDASAPVDPFRVANILAGGKGIGVVLPTRDLSFRGLSLSDGWGSAMDSALFSSVWEGIRLVDTLAFLASAPRSGSFDKERIEYAMADVDGRFPTSISFPCVSCGSKISLPIEERPLGFPCGKCQSPAWASDFLGIRKGLSDTAASASLEAMLAMEKLMGISSMLSALADPESKKAAVFLDGPLGAGPLSLEIRSFLRSLHEVRGFDRPWLVGVQKTGLLPRLAAMIAKDSPELTQFAQANHAFLKACFGPRSSAAKNLAKSGSVGEPYVLITQGKGYALWLPEGAGSRSGGKEAKEAIGIASAMVCWLYSNASLPNALAHRISSISVHPGLDAVSRLGREILSPSKISHAKNRGLDP